MMRLSEINRHISLRHGQGTPHNMGIKTTLEKVGHEIKENPPKILAHTKKKFGKARAEKQRKAILLSKARKEGAKIPLKK
ncbi:MAG: hypothetical protein QME16_00160 [Planctomycetota bacterium]|nr:hypothetical protein [Planctomycetota bacterium]